METVCQTIVLEEARFSAATQATWRHAEHEHPEAQVTVHLPASGGHTGTFEPRVRIFPPHSPHIGKWSSGTESVVFHLTPKTLEAAADEIYGMPRFELHGGEVQDPLIAHLAQVTREEIARGSANPMILDYIAHAVTGRLIRAHTGLLEGKRWARSHLTAHQLRTLREFIESRLDVGTSVRQLASVIGLGPQRLSAVLKGSTGFTPHAYVTHLRIIRARQLLRQTQLKLPEIALALGFAGQSHFGAVFRRYFGVTPQHYRNQSK